MERRSKNSSLENESKGDVKLYKFENIKIKDVRVFLPNDNTIEIHDMAINKGDRVLIKGASGKGIEIRIKKFQAPGYY